MFYGRLPEINHDDDDDDKMTDGRIVVVGLSAVFCACATVVRSLQLY